MTMQTVSTNHNRLLSALPADEYAYLRQNLESVKIKRGEIIHKHGEPIQHVYFPETCIVSMVTVFDDGTSVESGIIGREGMTGAGVVLSKSATARETYVQTGGSSLRIKTDNFLNALDQSHTLKQFASNYASAFFEQVAQAGACSNHHTLNERLARLLLMCYDRIEGNDIYITHEFIAQMLGAYRPNVTNAAMFLKDAKLIDYQRGLIRILDREGLESTACECYEAINEIYRHYLSTLEIRSLNRRAERADQEFAEQLRIRREVATQTREQLQNFRNAVAGIKSLSGNYVLCTGCYHVCDEHGHWRQMDFFMKKKFNITVSQSVCPNCSTNSPKACRK